jgi:sulfur carrier protein
MIEITVNGKAKSIEDNLSIDRLIETIGLSSKSIIIEYNGAVKKPVELAETKLAQGDKLEIIQIVGGG